MTYKRYIVINGKRYGPYEYKSFRDKNGVHSVRFKEKKLNLFSEEKEKRIFQIAGLLFLILALIFVIKTIEKNDLTGNVIINFDKDVFLVNETLNGKIGFILQKGEFIPADTQITITVDDEVKTMSFSEFVEKSSNQDIVSSENNFFITNKKDFRRLKAKK